MRKDSGFTLIELMVSITVAAILLTVGIPSMAKFLQTNRRAAAANTLIVEIQRARSTASSLGVVAVLCHSLNGTACSGEEDPDLAEGWILFIDDDQDADTNDGDGNGSVDSGETIISVAGERKGVTLPSNRSSFRFNPGYRLTTAGTVGVCVSKDNSNARWVVVSAVGRPRLKDAFGAGDPDCTSLGP